MATGSSLGRFFTRPDTLAAIERADRGDASAATLLALGEQAEAEGRGIAPGSPGAAMVRFRDAAAYGVLAATAAAADPGLCEQGVALHNRSLARCLRLALGHRGGGPSPVSHRLAAANIQVEAGSALYDLDTFDRLEVAEDRRVIGLDRHAVAGLGVPLLAARELPEPSLRSGLDRHYGDRLVPPLTAVLIPRGPAAGDGWRGMPLQLAVINPLEATSLVAAGRSFPVAADLTAPLAYQAERMPSSLLELGGAANPDRLAQRAGIYQLFPHRPGTIPVLFTHGLISSPGAWVPMYNELMADPFLRERYEFWFAYYPSGYPIPYSSALLRRELHDLQRLLDPEGADPGLHNMVAVGHSMGGIITRTFTQSSGDRLWDAYFTRPRGQVAFPGDSAAKVENLFYFEPEPAIRRAVFLAAPHRGSSLANRLIGRLGSTFMARSGTIRELRQEVLALNGLEVFQPIYRRRMISSIDNLEADSPVLETLVTLPTDPAVPFHSIIGNITFSDDPARWNDGVVGYDSAHIDGAESELIVPYRHTRCTTESRSIAEVRRILYLHLGIAAAPEL